MKKIFSLILVVLILITGLSGCDGSSGGDTKGLTQEQLWDYLDDYHRFLSVWGGEDAALVFKDGDDLIFDYSFYLGSDYNLYFTDLISFNYEGDNIYKLEYKNPYPDEMESGVFYIDLSSKYENKLSFGMYEDGELRYVDVFADVGLTQEELYNELNKYDMWLESTTEVYAYYFFRAHDKDQFELGLTNSGFWSNGKVSKVIYHGYMTYAVSVDYEAYEGDEITDPSDAHTTEYFLYYNPNFELLMINLSEKAVEFVPDVGLTANKLMEELEKYPAWLEATSELYGYYFVKFHDGDQFEMGLMNSGFWTLGTISNIKYQGHLTYRLTVDFPGSEGNEMEDPHDPYTSEIDLYYNPKHEILVITFYDKATEFIPDRSKSIDDFFNRIGYGYFRSEETKQCYRFEVKDGKYLLYVDDYNRKQNKATYVVKSLEYKGFLLYELVVDMNGTDKVWNLMFNDDNRKLGIFYAIDSDNYFVDEAERIE
ncbi:MAG: hypothetical protein ACOX1F_05175 [Erysipelotrichaceae bacterium]|jgi:hypothetical protein